ncbi:type III pantothenate kinase [cf. Phormidesmis sp. LEGE 11477]|uniref:type III pantothenate kinase n=1 Tax=cf. Phormidesmis sp. LEGE 11477 TaxID=1828680 RepID=UPI001881905E|nr:type III pantothenate kinase [cf. Phormidesmis sp. LEGE 11477]MBE9063904.1 type III pantothenate kinase [cf. Phormidesmis sp. LEGE 11477]
MSSSWLALVVGNTRLHWGWFDQSVLVATWHTCHLSNLAIDRIDTDLYPQNTWLLINSLVSEPEISYLLQDVMPPIELWLASVVPAQTHLWQQVVPSVHLVSRSHIPLNNIYPTLGLDRAINLLGANQTLDWPILVIDSGTALTLTAGVSSSPADAYDGSGCNGSGYSGPVHDGEIYGGAILPGVRLQLNALGQQTALGSLMLTALETPEPSLQRQLPKRWASNSEGAIASGIAYSLTSTCIDYISDWWQAFPGGAVVFTGGDGPLLYQYLQQRAPEIASRVLVDENLMFKGMQAYRRELTT